MAERAAARGGRRCAVAPTLLLVPTGGEAVSRFGALRLTIEQGAGGVTARTELEITRDRIAPNEYEDFRAWVERADALLRQRISLRGGAR